MLKLRAFLKYWLPVLVWMAVIYSASSDTESQQHSSRFIGPALHWLFPGWSALQIDRGIFIVRKIAHLTEYGILAGLVFLALRFSRGRFVWAWSHAGFALLFVLFYAITDEVHQRFVPTRTGTPWDVLIDTIGGMCGLAAIWAATCLWKLRRRPPAAGES